MNKRVIIIGLGKTGYSCVRYFKSREITENYKHYSILVIDNKEQPPLLAQLQLDYPDVEFRAGSLQTSDIDIASVIVLSPGVDARSAIITLARDRGVEITNDIDLFCKETDVPMAAITGSNAKTTVTTLLGEMARECGINVGVGGNIGRPVLDFLLDDQRYELFVLELSSFQLELAHHLSPRVATILNITADHMDRYDSLSHYKSAKQQIYPNAQTIVYNRQDQTTVPVKCSPSQNTLSFGADQASTETDFGLMRTGGKNYLTFGEALLIEGDQLRLRGIHNWVNALSALALGTVLHFSMAKMLDVLRTFKGLPHRCEWIANKNSIDFYNDSKGTNVGATIAALEGLGQALVGKGKIILLAGGVAKNASFSELVTPISTYCRHVLLYGRDADFIKKQLDQFSSITMDIRRIDTLEDAVIHAFERAKSGDIILLSPACASFDMFENFEHRGRAFIKAVEQL